MKEGCEISYLQRRIHEVIGKKPTDQASQGDLSLWWKLPRLWESQQNWKPALKGTGVAFYRHCNLGPRSKILLNVLCPASKPLGGPKRKEQAVCSIWMCKGGTWSELTLSQNLHLSFYLSYLKEVPIFLQRRFSPKAVKKSTKLIAAVILSVLWTQHWERFMRLLLAFHHSSKLLLVNPHYERSLITRELLSKRTTGLLHCVRSRKCKILYGSFN